jgi:hypothetical protein
MRCDEKQRRVPFSDIARGLNQGLESADPLRTAGLQRLVRVREIKETSLQREHKRLQAKLGADHPRVAELATRMDANRDLKRDAMLGVSRAATPTARPDKNTWILHGYVRDRSRQGLEGLTISLYDEKNQWIEELGFACTDKNGYFQLRNERPNTQETDPAAAVRQAFIHVLDKQGAVLYVDKCSLTPAPGRVDYREIILDKDANKCLPPPRPVRPPDKPPDTGKPVRYLGDANKRTVHDLEKVTPRCQVDAIRPDHRTSFKTQKEALAAGYDYCAFCFGKPKSKRK